MIKRPVLAIVIAIIIVILGTLSLLKLPVEQYPDITPPQVTVSAYYPGADASVVSESVTEPLSQAIIGVEDMLYMQSTSDNSGNSTITITFSSLTDPDVNTMLTQNRVNSALSLLPSSVKEQGVDVKKSMSNFLLVYALYGDENYSEQFLSNYAINNIRNNLLKIEGVGGVSIMGAGEYAMRIWVKPDMLAYYDISVEEIKEAIEAQSGIYPLGSLGAEPTPLKPQFTYSVILPPQIETPEQYADIVLRTTSSGAEVKLSDIATVEFGTYTYGISSKYNRGNCAVMLVYQSPGSNAFDVGNSVKSAMSKMEERFPSGISYATLVDTTTVISEGTREIIYTLLFALLLVVVIIYLFVQDSRAMIIPIVAIPVSLIGAFMLFPLLGFSINVFSLLGLVLAIGLVVDDAIVVVEAVQVGLEKGLKPKEATLEAMKFVRSPIIATTLVMAAVFVPVSLMESVTGVLYQQFAITIAISVLISALNALSLSPVLCSIWLKEREVKTKGFFGWFNRSFKKFSDHYLRVVTGIGKRAWIAVTMIILAIIASALMFNSLPTGFLPQNDQGYLMTTVTLPDASSVERTKEVVNEVSEIISKNPYVEETSSLSGFNLLAGITQTNSGILFINLKDGKRPSAFEIADMLNGELFEMVSGGETYTFGPPSIPGIGTTSGFTMMLQQKGAANPIYLEDEMGKFLEKANSSPEIAMAYTMYRGSIPARKINIDKNLALTEGISLNELHSTLAAFLGGTYVNNINRFGKLYDTFIGSEGNYRSSENDLNSYYVANGTGKQVPISAFVSFSDTTNVEYLTSFNLLNAATVMGSGAAGYSTDDVIGRLSDIADKTLPPDMSYEWSDMSYQDVNASSNVSLTYIIAIVFIFLVLASLYENWYLPLTILLGVPFAMFGALLFLFLSHLIEPSYTNNIFFQVSLIMLIALSAKNAILIIEYAEKSYVEGGTLFEAALKAASLRIRPIIMTALAFIVGISPLIFATGSNATARNIMGISLVGGMALATFLGVVVYPALYVLVGKIGRFDKRREKMKEEIS